MQNMSNPDSALLRCLASLDVDAWAQVLLPKLVAQGSARAITGTCIQLRDFCFDTVHHIDLSSVQSSGDISQVEGWVKHIPQHFKNATSVQLSFEEELSYHIALYLLPALKG
jgi:hypothetical protein